MFTTGSKLLIGGSVLATVAAIVYGVSQNEALGIVGLISAAIALSLIAAFNVWARDSNLSALDATVVATSDAATEPPDASIWPMVFAVGGATVLVGLVTQQTEEESPRVEALVSTTDGFALAEIDLDLRGEGTLMSTAQKGRSDLKLASLRRDRKLVEQAREAAFRIVDADPELTDHRVLADELDLIFSDRDEEFLSRS